jgi:serine/threonine protein kinase
LTKENDIKICDFGISMYSYDEHVEEVSGTKYYQSPEQARKEKLSYKTDIW